MSIVPLNSDAKPYKLMNEDISIQLGTDLWTINWSNFSASILLLKLFDIFYYWSGITRGYLLIEKKVIACFSLSFFYQLLNYGVAKFRRLKLVLLLADVCNVGNEDEAINRSISINNSSNINRGLTPFLQLVYLQQIQKISRSVT